MTITTARIRALSQLLFDIGNIFFASVFLGPLFFDKPSYFTGIIGLLLAFAAWVLGIKLTK